MEQVQVGLLVLIACVGAGAVSDIILRRIPNWMCLATAALGLIFGALEGLDVDLLWQVASMILALVAGIGIYALKFWGGGDAKFFAGTAAWFSLFDLGFLVFAISLAGVVLTLLWYIWNVRIKDKTAALRNSQIPYGVAIAAGGIATAILV